MNMTFLIALGLFFVSFIAPAICYSFASRKGIFNLDRSSNSAFLPIFFVLLATTLLVRLLFYAETDFIGSFGFLQIIIPFTGAFLIFATGRSSALQKWSLPVLVIAVLLSVAVMPAETMNIAPTLPALTNRLILTFIWLFFPFLYIYLNNGSGSLAIQSVTFGFGIGIIGILNAIPLMLGMLGWTYAAAFLALAIFTWHPSRIKISHSEATAFGFLTFALIAPVSAEGAASCCLIFCLFFLIDFCWALFLKLTFLPRFDNFFANSGFQQAVADGLDPGQAAAFITKSKMIMLLFGCFQIYSPAPWSLLLISSLITLWLNYRFRNIPAPVQKLRDINSQVLEELQDRVNEFKNYIKKDNNF